MNMFGGLGAGSLSVPNQPDGELSDIFSHKVLLLDLLYFWVTTKFIFIIFSSSPRRTICYTIITTPRNGFL